MTAWIISSSVLILTVAVLRRVLRGRTSLGMQYALWLLVLVRLLVPVNFGASSLSVMNAVPERVQVSAEQPDREVGQASTATAAPAQAPAAPTSPISGQDRPQSSTQPVTASPDTGRRAVSWEQAARAVWLAGTAIVGAVFLAANLHFYGKLRRSRRKVDAQAALPVYESSAILTPCLFGLICPAIYVTPEVLAEEETLRYALVHEETHRRHGDNLWALLRGVCLALHWYNPLVWWAAELSRRDAELACDEGVIRRIGEGARAAYGRTLLRLTCETRAAPFVAATMMTDSGKGLRERITLLVKKPRTTACAALAMLAVILLAAACTFTGEKNVEKPESTPAGEKLNSTADTADAPLADFRLYVPRNSMEPDTVSADTMGDILVDEILPDGTRIVCYWEPGSEYTKYWAVRQGDTLLRFCVEESAYNGDYGVEPFSNVLGQSGFRILAPRGAGYFAYDYYVPDGDGVPRLLAGCANEVEEADFNGDGETDLRWYSHGNTEVYTYFRYGGRLYLAHSTSNQADGFSSDPLPVLPLGDAAENTGAAQLAPVSAGDFCGTLLPDEAFAAERAEFLNAGLDLDAIRRNVRETSNLQLLQTLPEQGISLYGYHSEQCLGYGLVFYVSGTRQLYRIPIPYMDNHAILPELYMGPDHRLYLIAHTGSGTGISISELYVFRPDQDMTMDHIDFGQLTDALSGAIRVRYDSRTERAGIYDLNGTLLAEAGIGAIGIKPDEAFVPDAYYCGAYLHYTVSENGSIQASFDVRLRADSSVGDGALNNDPMLTAEVRLQFDESGSVSGLTVENLSIE